MKLTLRYTTAANFDNHTFDDDQLSLTAHILYDPSEEVD